MPRRYNARAHSKLAISSILRPSVLETGPSPAGERVRELVPLPFPLPNHLAGGGGAAGGGSPCAVELLVVTDRVDELVAGFGLKEPLAPLGSSLTASPIEPVKPPLREIETL